MHTVGSETNNVWLFHIDQWVIIMNEEMMEVKTKTYKIITIVEKVLSK